MKGGEVDTVRSFMSLPSSHSYLWFLLEAFLMVTADIYWRQSKNNVRFEVLTAVTMNNVVF
jgi:hypothetical protein